MKSKLENISDNTRNKSESYNYNGFNSSYDYLQYVSDKYGTESFAYRIIEGLLAHEDIAFAMKLNSVGVINDYDIDENLAGAVITNPNGVSAGSTYTGTDTNLGLLNNSIFGEVMYQGALFNEVRHRDGSKDTDDLDISTRVRRGYITKSLAKEYGNNISNIYKLTDLFTVYPQTGRIRDDLSAQIIYDYTDSKLTDYGNKVYLDDLMKYNEERGFTFKEEGYSQNKPYIIFDYDTKNFLKSELNSYFDIVEPNDNLIGLNRKLADGTVTKIVNYNKISSPKHHFIYAEGDNPEPSLQGYFSDSNSNEWDEYTDTYESNNNNLISKTNELFRKHKIETMIARFHDNNNGENSGDNNTYTIDTAINDKYGRSHGRNLLKAKPDDVDPEANGYSNPYCRVWTFHKQYDKINRLIRDGNKIDKSYTTYYRTNKTIIGKSGKTILDGEEYLRQNTVLDSQNGHINITPKYSGDNDYNSITKCMFSIENLAWKDVFKINSNINSEQRGPNDGRIMWFPPYGLDFQENVTVNWAPNTFIGRGEKVYTYTDTDRTGQLNFVLLVDHPSIINSFTNNKLSTGIEDDDVLRFFAGCFDPTEKMKANIVEDLPDNIVKEPVDEFVPNPKQTISFMVFFPNNYSGYMDGGNGGLGDNAQLGVLATQSKTITNSNDVNPAFNKEFVGLSNLQNALNKTNNGNIKPDSDWADYLIKGSDLNSYGGNGYEMNNIGISTATTASIESKLPYCELKYYTRNGNKINGPYISKTHSNYNFHYRVDNDLNQKLTSAKDYIDTKSFNLNSSVKAVNDAWGEGTVNYSFKQMYYAINGIETEDKGVQEINKIFYMLKNNSGLTIDSINITGMADNHDQTNKDKLANRRAASVINWLGNSGEIPFNKSYNIKLTNRQYGGTSKQSVAVGDKNEKKHRCVKVDIIFNQPVVQTVAETETNIKKIKKDEWNNNLEFNKIIDWDYVKSSYLDYQRNGGTASLNEYKNKIYPPDESYIISETDKNIEKIGAKTQRQSQTEQIVAQKSTKISNESSRYENEAQYFQRIKNDDPLIYKKITDKFKHFDPAFHSMSPEGFNARLTFLHQCTRQGHTISASDGVYAQTAGNLSFGRMPVCVLRIGDFIYSKILIQSVSIIYSEDGMHWDLNPEGIGIQPMFAKVSMGIVIIGGQSLEGPINRLQNAVTFNYYANSGVYDDRSDIAKTENGVITYKNIWSPKNDNTKK